MSNAQKTPYVESANALATKKALDALQGLGHELPCSVVKAVGAIVTVKFEVQSGFTLPNVTVPLFGPEYIRYPIQAGDKGVVFASDAYLGGMSGLGGGVAGMAAPGNLSALVFFPIGNTKWFTVDPGAVVIYGPNGVVLQDSGKKVTFTLTPSGIAIKGNVTLQGNFTVTGNISATGGVVAGQGSADQVGLQTHDHTNSGGTGIGGPPVPGS